MTTNDERLISKIKDVGKKVVKYIDEDKNPTLEILTRSLSNVYYDKDKQMIQLGKNTQKRYYFNLNQAKKFMQTVLIASACKDLIETGKTTSIRDLFYMTKHTIADSTENTFDEQSESIL